MEGLGTDEDTLTLLLCSMPEKYTKEIQRTYREVPPTSPARHLCRKSRSGYQILSCNVIHERYQLFELWSKQVAYAFWGSVFLVGPTPLQNGSCHIVVVC